MSLKIKSIKEILSTLIVNISSRTKKITDFNVGSATRTLLESIALQLEEFYFDMRQNVEYAIENAIYNAFGFEKIAETKASGYVTVNFVEALPNSMIISMGTIFSTSLQYNKVIQFKSTEDVVADKGSLSVMVPVECTTGGTDGNVGAGEIRVIVTGSSMIESVTNQTAFVNGVNEETSMERKHRFREYIRSLSKATRDSIAYGTKEVDGITGVWVDDNYIGFVRVYTHDKDGNLSEELKQAVLTNLEKYRAAGVEVEVLPIVKKETNISLFFVLKDEVALDDYLPNIKQLVVDYLNSFEVASNLYMTNLIGTITENYRDVIVTFDILEGEDTNLQNNELIVAGVVEVTGVNLKDWRK